MEVSGDNQFDVIIVGAGIMGSCTAYEVAKRGLRPLLLEQFDFLHHLGSSHGESRTIRSTYPEPYYAPMVLDSYRLWEEAQAEIGYRVLTKTSHLDIGPKLNKALQSVIANSVPNKTQIFTQNFSDSFRLPDEWIGVATEEGGGVLKPGKAVAMFQSLAVRRGAILKDHMEVVDIEKDGGGLILVSTSHQNKFWGKKCVVTSGAWTEKLVEKVSGVHLPIRPLHTVICYWKINKGFEKQLSAGGGFPTFASYGEPYVYGTPSMEFPGLIKIAMHGGRTCDPDRRDWGGGAVGLVEPVGRWIGEVMPDSVEAGGGPVMTQACMYSMTPDEDFVIDFVGRGFGRDVVVAGGFSGHGFKMGPVVGRILAQMALDEEVTGGIEMEWFRIGRFEDNPNGNVKEYGDQVSSSSSSRARL